MPDRHIAPHRRPSIWISCGACPGASVETPPIIWSRSLPAESQLALRALLVLMVLAGGTPLPGEAADNPRVAEYLCPTTGEGETPQTRLPESMAAPAEAAVASQLVYYRPEHGAGVFGPKGWSCRAWIGSSGGLLLVTPKP